MDAQKNDGIIDMIDILLTMLDEGIKFDNVEDFGKELIRRYEIKRNNTAFGEDISNYHIVE